MERKNQAARIILISASSMALAALAFFLVNMGIFAHILSEESKQIIPAIERQSLIIQRMSRAVIEQELESTRKLVSDELQSTRDSITSELDSTRTDLLGRLDAALVLSQGVVNTVDTRLVLIQQDANSHLSRIESTLDSNLDETLQPVQKSLDLISESIYEMVVCYDEETGYHNADCLYNRYVGAMRGVENTSESIARLTELIEESTPKILDSTTGIADNVDEITANVNKAVDQYVNPPWWKKIINIGVAAGPALWGIVTK